MKVSIIELDSKLYTMTMHLMMPKMGCLEVSTYLAQNGHDVSTYIECMNGLDEHDICRSDVIGFSVGSANASRCYEMLHRLRRKSHAVFVAGGPHATMLPDEMLDRGFDYVVRAEGEATAVDLLATIERGGDASEVKGISYRSDGQNIHNPPRTFMKTFDYVPSYSLMKGFRRKNFLEQLRIGKVYENFLQTTRGCPFPCDFCYETRVGGTGYRKRSIKSVIEDTQYKIDFLRTNVFYITDANFALDAKYTKELLQAMINAGIRARFSALTRIEIAHDDELLRLLKESGFEMICAGIESLDDDTLDSVGKKQRYQEIEHCVAKMRSFGLGVFGLFIGGFERDTEQSFVRMVDFALRHSLVGINIMTLGDYPGHPDCIVPSHRYFNQNYDYNVGHYITFFMPNMRPSKYQRVVSRETLRFYSWKTCLSRLFTEGWHSFYHTYGGRFVYQNVWKEGKRYLPYLEAVEREHYRGDQFLSDERLREEYERLYPTPPRARVISTVSPTTQLSSPARSLA